MEEFGGGSEGRLGGGWAVSFEGEVWEENARALRRVAGGQTSPATFSSFTSKLPGLNQVQPAAAGSTQQPLNQVFIGTGVANLVACPGIRPRVLLFRVMKNISFFYGLKAFAFI